MSRYQATVASRRPAPDTFGYLATLSAPPVPRP
jgi:hypothetical protein